MWKSSIVIRWIHRVADILLGFGPKDAGSIPAGSIRLIKAIMPDYPALAVCDLNSIRLFL
jgi:hypothetical protein